MNREAQILQNQAWTIFNAAFQEPAPIREGMRETGISLLHQAVVTQKDALFARGDAQNLQIQEGLKLQQVRAELATMPRQPVGAAR